MNHHGKFTRCIFTIIFLFVIILMLIGCTQKTTALTPPTGKTAENNPSVTLPSTTGYSNDTATALSNPTNVTSSTPAPGSGVKATATLANGNNSIQATYTPASENASQTPTAQNAATATAMVLQQATFQMMVTKTAIVMATQGLQFQPTATLLLGQNPTSTLGLLGSPTPTKTVGPNKTPTKTATSAPTLTVSAVMYFQGQPVHGNPIAYVTNCNNQPGSVATLNIYQAKITVTSPVHLSYKFKLTTPVVSVDYGANTLNFVNPSSLMTQSSQSQSFTCGVAKVELIETSPVQASLGSFTFTVMAEPPTATTKPITLVTSTPKPIVIVPTSTTKPTQGMIIKPTSTPLGIHK